MIDTLKLRFRQFPTKDQLAEFWNATYHGNILHDTWISRFTYVTDATAAIQLRATYYPDDSASHEMLMLAFSLPKVLFEKNWPMVIDLPKAIAIIDERLALVTALPPLPSIADAEVIRLDACYNYQVGADLPAILKALAKLQYPHRQTVPFMGTGVEFRAKVSKTKFYDKRQETIDLNMRRSNYAPPGTLRHESNYHKARNLANALRLSCPFTLGQVEPEAILDILRRDLQHLGIEACFFATAETALANLSAAYGPTRGLRLYGALCASQDRSKPETAAELGVERHSVARLLREARKAGIAPCLIEPRPVAPLQIQWPPPGPPSKPIEHLPARPGGAPDEQR